MYTNEIKVLPFSNLLKFYFFLIGFKMFSRLIENVINVTKSDCYKKQNNNRQNIQHLDKSQLQLFPPYLNFLVIILMLLNSIKAFFQKNSEVLKIGGAKDLNTKIFVKDQHNLAILQLKKMLRTNNFFQRPPGKNTF